MARKIFIAATGQHCGKTTTSLALLMLARAQGLRVGFLKPLGPKPIHYAGHDGDRDAALIAELFGQAHEFPLMSPVVLQSDTTRRIIDGEMSAATFVPRIIEACAALEDRCELLIIEGAGHAGVGSVAGLSNADMARLLDASVMMVTEGGIGRVVDSVCLNLCMFREQGVRVRCVVANKLNPAKRDQSIGYLQRALLPYDLKVLGGFNYQPVLANPTLRRISRLLGRPLLGGVDSQAGRIIHHVQIGAASTWRVAELLQESTLLIVTSSRDELLVTLANLYQMPEYREKIVGLVVPGIIPVSRITQKILDHSGIPYLRTTEHTTAELHNLITEDVSKITSEDQEKIDLLRKLAPERFDLKVLLDLFP
jgi:dethiobiotin synthetase